MGWLKYNIDNKKAIGNSGIYSTLCIFVDLEGSVLVHFVLINEMSVL